MDRKKRMLELREKGLSYQSIGDLLGISRQRVHQIISGYGLLVKSGKKRDGWYSEIKKIVFERDNHKCQRCGSTDSLILHHLDGNDLNNEFHNLVLLCRTCHQNMHKPSSKKFPTTQVFCNISSRLITKLQNEAEQLEKGTVPSVVSYILELYFEELKKGDGY